MAAGLGVAILPAAVWAQEPSATAPAAWGKPMIDGGACCHTLGEVRSNIDRIDREIVRLMAERGRYVREAARFKTSPGTVEAPGRVAAIVRRVRRLADEDGLPPEVAEATYRAMVRAFTDYEKGVVAAGTGLSGKAPAPSSCSQASGCP